MIVPTWVDIQYTNLHDVTSQNTKILIGNAPIASNLSSSKNYHTHVAVQVSPYVTLSMKEMKNKEVYRSLAIYGD
jgi:hypothetical protein